LMVPLVLEAVRDAGAAAPAGVGAGAPPRLDPPAGGRGGLSLLVLPDHPTPLEIMTHVAEPVPFLMWGPGFAANGAAAYTEKEARATGFAVVPGHLLMSMFLG
jgi:hypothetical protein